MSETTLNFFTAITLLLSTLIAWYTMLELPSPKISPYLHLMIFPYSIGSGMGIGTAYTFLPNYGNKF